MMQYGYIPFSQNRVWSKLDQCNIHVGTSLIRNTYTEHGNSLRVNYVFKFFFRNTRHVISIL